MSKKRSSERGEEVAVDELAEERIQAKKKESRRDRVRIE